MATGASGEMHAHHDRSYSSYLSLIAGVLILVMPRLLNLVVAIYLICVGVIGLGLLKLLHI
jgi:hypothetical protein